MRGLLRIGGYRKECEVLIIKKPFFQKVLEILPKKHVFAKQKSSFLSTGSFFRKKVSLRVLLGSFSG